MFPVSNPNANAPAEGKQPDVAAPQESAPNQPQGVSLSPEVKALLDFQAEMDKRRDAAVKSVQDEINRLNTEHARLVSELTGVLNRIAPGSAVNPANTPTESSSKYNPQKYCPYCKLPGHDGRAHRGQSVPRKFSIQELTVYGLIPPTGLPADFATAA